MTSGIYSIRNVTSGKRYVGQSVDIKGRWFNGHRPALRSGRHSNPRLQNAWNKYGEDVFEHIVLLECCAAEFDVHEIAFIKKYGAYGRGGYNQTEGGCGVTAETRVKISSTIKKRWQNDAVRRATHKKAMAEFYARPEASSILGAGQRRRWSCPEARAERSASMKGNTNRAIMCVIDGVTFASIHAAGEALGLSYYMLKKSLAEQEQ